jgi:hypothetical protein
MLMVTGWSRTSPAGTRPVAPFGRVGSATSTPILLPARMPGRRAATRALFSARAARRCAPSAQQARRGRRGASAGCGALILTGRCRIRVGSGVRTEPPCGILQPATQKTLSLTSAPPEQGACTISSTCTRSLLCAVTSSGARCRALRRTAPCRSSPCRCSLAGRDARSEADAPPALPAMVSPAATPTIRPRDLAVCTGGPPLGTP